MENRLVRKITEKTTEEYGSDLETDIDSEVDEIDLGARLPDFDGELSFGCCEVDVRELVLVKITVDSRTRSEVMQITDIFRAKIVDVQPKSLTIEITGNESKVEKFLELMKGFGILDLTRTGKVALPRK